MKNLLNLIRADLCDFNAYRSARDEAHSGQVWLNANELPWNDFSADDNDINRYPQKQPAQLIEQLAKIYQVHADQLAMLRGSDEAIDLLTRLFCRAEKDAVLICPPTFGMYAVCGRLQGAKVIEVPLSQENDFQLDTAAILENYRPELKIIFLCSPNNPTGNLLKREDIFFLCKQLSEKCLVVVDEAYVEFSDTDSLAKYINDYDNLAILRTFSKAYGLAGARCGFLLAQANLIRWILAIAAPYPLSTLTVAAVAKSIKKPRLQQLKTYIDCVKSERERLFIELKKIKMIKKIWVSDANFLLFAVECAQRIMDECAKQGIVLRNMHDKPGLKNCIRITIGTPEENDLLLDVLKTLTPSLSRSGRG